MTCAWRASGEEKKGGGGDVSRALDRLAAKVSAASDAMAGAPRICQKDVNKEMLLETC